MKETLSRYLETMLKNIDKNMDIFVANGIDPDFLDPVKKEITNKLKTLEEEEKQVGPKKYEVVVDDVYNRVLSRSRVVLEAKDLKQLRQKIRNGDYEVIEEWVEWDESQHVGLEIVSVKECDENNKKGKQDEQN